MNRTELEKWSREELIDRITVIEERERRAGEFVQGASFTINCSWVKGSDERPALDVPFVDISQMLLKELVDCYERHSPLDRREDGWEGPFLKAATVTYTQGSFQRTNTATFAEEEL